MSCGPSVALGGPWTSVWAFRSTALPLRGRPPAVSHRAAGVGILVFAHPTTGSPCPHLHRLVKR